MRHLINLKFFKLNNTESLCQNFKKFAGQFSESLVKITKEILFYFDHFKIIEIFVILAILELQIGQDGWPNKQNFVNLILIFTKFGQFFIFL